jgi:hypothetical protein
MAVSVFIVMSVPFFFKGSNIEGVQQLISQCGFVWPVG